MKDNRQVSVSLAHKGRGIMGTLFAGKLKVPISRQWGRKNGPSKLVVTPRIKHEGN